MYKLAAAKNHQNTRDKAGRIATGSARGMSLSRIDFAVMGESPQARLIAGLLSSVHKKSVIYGGESQSGYRLPRGIDLSVAPITRPETWALLQNLVPETRKLIARLGGRNSISRIDPIFQADSANGSDAIGHIRHMAGAFDIPAERVPVRLLEPGSQGVLFRAALLLHRASLEPVLDRWLASVGVFRMDAHTPLLLGADGSAEFISGEQHFKIGQTVLADDAAITAHLPSASWPRAMAAQITSTSLLEPGKPQSAVLRHHLDTGVMLSQHAHGGVIAIGPGTIEQVNRAAQPLLGNELGHRQAGQSSYRHIHISDGAPAVGRVGGAGADIVAGFGLTGAFFAPALARWLAGCASEAENTWFAARLADRDPTSSVVAEWGATR